MIFSQKYWHLLLDCRLRLSATSFGKGRKEALARKKAEGVTLGRPKGRKSSPDKYKLSGKETLIRELLKEGISKRKIAKICKVDRNTLARFIKLMEEK